MSFPEMVVTLLSFTETVHEEDLLVIIRNMAGQDAHRLAVKKTAFFWHLRAHISRLKELDPRQIRLTLNFEEPDDFMPMYRLEASLAENGNALQLLVDEEQQHLCCTDHLEE